MKITREIFDRRNFLDRSIRKNENSRSIFAPVPSVQTKNSAANRTGTLSRGFSATKTSCKAQEFFPALCSDFYFIVLPALYSADDDFKLSENYTQSVPRGTFRLKHGNAKRLPNFFGLLSSKKFLLYMTTDIFSRFFLSKNFVRSKNSRQTVRQKNKKKADIR